MRIFKKKDKAPLKQFAMDLVRHDRDQHLSVRGYPKSPSRRPTSQQCKKKYHG